MAVIEAFEMVDVSQDQDAGAKAVAGHAGVQAGAIVQAGEGIVVQRLFEGLGMPLMCPEALTHRIGERGRDHQRGNNARQKRKAPHQGVGRQNAEADQRRETPHIARCFDLCAHVPPLFADPSMARLG